MIHRRNHFRGEKILHDRVMNNPKISIIWDSAVEEVIGDETPNLSVTGVKIKNVKTGQATMLPVAGLFIAIGHDPRDEAFQG